ncbi:MAG: hypothetical protein HOJ65_09495 [Verrucomicrobia bacterium]|nr:hypothetical protein [Verrucomicrobiota bacterium]
MKIKIINSLAAAALLTGSLGVLQAEKAKSTDAKPAKAKAAKKSDRPSQRAVFIKRFDKDGDGKLNEAERKAAGAARKAQGARQSDRVSDKARPNSGGREGYAAAAKRIKEAVKAGKITEAQGKERLAAYRKRMGEGRGDSGRSRQTREELMKRYDKNKDGKLDEDERAALRKAMSDRNSGKRSPGSDEKNAKRKRPSQGNKKNAERKRRGSDRGKRSENK